MTEAPYGTWPSPVSSDVVAGDSGSIYSEPSVADGAVYWLEARPHEDGRVAIVVRRPGGGPEDAIGAGFSARSRVHEYGGGPYTVHGTTLYFCHDADGRIYRGETPITPEPETPHGLRYADLRVTPDGATLVCVRERGDVNELVALPADGSGEAAIVAGGRDFYAAPRVSPDGTRLAWLTWDHPRMPWEGCELWVSDLDGSGAERVAGGPEESILQPEWSADGVLHHLSDRTGWWNLYRDGDEPLTSLEAEVGGPLWVLGQNWYAFSDDGRIVLTFTRDGTDALAVLEPGGTLREVDTGLTRIYDLTTDGTRAVFVGASATRSGRVVAADLQTGAAEILSADGPEAVEARYVSVPEPYDYETTGGRTAHALFYAPQNPDATAPAGERPPLLVRVHGGPTSQATGKLDPEIQFFTTRGFAVVEVNYGGSTGYGREYRDRLRGQWGVVDTDDAVNAARTLAAAGRVDGGRMAITGGSAGGWTVLCALAFAPGVFAVGADYYGVADLSDFGADTHKFESHYEDYLIGPLPESRALRIERSPVTHADAIRAPVIVLQGSEDKVVPPSQSEAIVAALERSGVEHRYLVFAGEQHGFRKADSVRRAIEAEFAFYAKVLGFTPATEAAAPST